MKANRKQLKAVLVLGVRNFGPTFVALKLVEFPLFNNFFLDLAKFWDLDIFLLFDFPNFLAYSTPFPPIPNLLTSLLSSFLPKAGLLLSFLLKADLLPLFLLGASLSGNLIVFSIEVSTIAILLKPWINCR